MTDAHTSSFRSLVPDSRPAPVTAFERALRGLLDELFASQPVAATHIGFHAYDDRWPDMTEAGRQARLGLIGRQRAVLAALDPAALSADERIDLGIVLEALDSLEFEVAQLREPAWDALSYVALAGSGLFGLLAREFAPWQHRGSAFVGRLRGLPALLATAADNLVGTPAMPVSKIHASTALVQLRGVGDLIAEGLAEADKHSVEDGGAQIAEAMRDAAEPARAALDEFERRLRDEILPAAQGDGRLGAELFGQKLRHTLASDLSPAEIEQRARGDYDLVRAELLRLAREMWPDWLPGRPMPADEDELVRSVLDAVGRVHRQPGELLEFSRAEVARIEQFCRERSVIGLPPEPLEIIWTPVFMRAYGRAFLESPGVLDKGLASNFMITPPDEGNGPEAVESYLREDNDRMLRLLAIHEGVPGHYLQLAWSNRTPSLARGVFSSGAFIEGWAVYVTQVMMDLGYGDHEPALMLIHWKFYLRAIINALIDAGIHTSGMTEQEAMTLMVEGGFQEHDEASAKWLRAQLSSTQLSTYYVGSLEMWQLEIDARHRAATAAGATPDEVPPQRIAGGLGETPGFDYRSHLESVISHGSPPIKWVRRALMGE